MKNFDDETIKSIIMEDFGFDPVSVAGTYDFAEMFGEHMDDEDMPALGQALLNGEEMCFFYKEKGEALDLLYDLFENNVYERPHLACIYPDGVDEDPIEADSPKEISREDLHELMGPCGLGICLLDGYKENGDLLPYAVIWSSYEDSAPEALILASTDSGPYPDLGWLLAFMLNAGHV